MARARDLVPAFAYLRTSSAANVGSDKDSETRRRAAIEAFARRAGFAIVATFYDAAVSGEDQLVLDRHPVQSSIDGVFIKSWMRSRTR